jgi:hypothetical protein
MPAVASDRIERAMTGEFGTAKFGLDPSGYFKAES